MVLRAETGSGKTLAYLIPILEALRKRVEFHDPSMQLLPVGLILTPSIELASQVCSVARELYPEHANMVHLCHGERGATRRQNAGILVATPQAAVESINPVHLTALRTLVLDEADALLSGSFAQPIRTGVLSKLKQLLPEQRPTHVFCAATLPSKGKDSVIAFLERYYPEACRVTTEGSHRPLPQVHQSFWQVDASLPLSPQERGVASRLETAAEALGRREGILAANDTTTALHSKENEDPTPPTTPHTASLRLGRAPVDNIAQTMAARKGEDEYLAGREAEAEHTRRVWSLTLSATFQALLYPAVLLGLLESAEVGKGISSSGHSLTAKGQELLRAHSQLFSGSSSTAHSPPTFSRDLPDKAATQGGATTSNNSRSLLLGGLEEGWAPSAKRLRSQARLASRSARSLIGVDNFPRGWCPPEEAPALGGGWVHTGADEPPAAWKNTQGVERGEPKPFVPPRDRTPPTLSPELAALVPPTLIFLNSGEAAGKVSRWLGEKCGGLFRVGDLSAGLPLESRGERLDAFRNSEIRVLVCTNVAARGLDLRGATHVIQAQFAQDVVSHLHRMGRVGRAGAGGVVTSLVTRSGVTLATLCAQAQVEKNDVLLGASRVPSSTTGKVMERALSLALEREGALSTLAPK